MIDRYSMKTSTPLQQLLCWAAASALLCAVAQAGQPASAALTSTSFESFTWRNTTQLEVCFYDVPTTTNPKTNRLNVAPIDFTYETISIECTGTPFTFAYDDNETNVFISPGCAEPANGGLLCGAVEVDPDTLSYDTLQTYQVFTESLRASSKFRMFIKPEVLFMDRLKEAQVTMVRGVGADYNISNCTLLTTSTCYFSDLNVIDLLCTETLDEQGGELIRVCDASFDDAVVANQTDVSSVVLSYEREAIEVWPAEAPSTVHLAICDSQGQDCKDCGGLSCTVDKVATSDSHVILIVALDDEAMHATSSRRETVQDLLVETRWLSQDSMEVTWQGAEDVSYSVWTANDTADLVEVSCSACEHLFIRLSSDDHVVQVQQESSLVRIEVPANFQPVAEANFDLSLHHTTSDSFSTIETKSCVTSTSDQCKPDTFFLVDSQNVALKSTARLNNCASFNVISSSFDTSGLTRVLVTGKSSQFGNQVCSSQFGLYFFLPQVDQLSDAAGEVFWRNKNSAKSYEMKSMLDTDTDLSPVSCSVGAKCRYYVAPDSASNLTFTLKEQAVVNQWASANIEPGPIQTLIIADELTSRYDDHLLVCFDPPAGEVYRYELGMEREGELISSDDRAQIQEKEGQTCAVTSKAVLLGGYVNLWAIVVAYDSNGSIISSGDNSFQDLYLSEDRGIYGLVKNNSDLFDLMCSWKLVDDSTNLESYTVNLLNQLGEEIKSEVLDITSTTYVFEGLTEGYYMACVAVNGHSITSGLVCSDSIRATADVSTELIPKVETSSSLITSDNQVKITWSLSEEDLQDVSTFLIEYKLSSEMTQERPIRQASPPMHPDLYIEESGNSGLAGFRIVPATQTSADLPLVAGSWNICLSAMRGNQAGSPQCQETNIETPPEVEAPESLSYDETSYLLTWEAPSASDGLSLIYYIEGSRGSSLQHTNTSETSVNLADFVGSGEWSIAVHTLQDEKYLSDASELPVIINGLEISTAQTGYREMRVSWLEYGADPAPSEAVVYTVNFHESITQSVICSAQCLVYITDHDAKADESFEVVVTNTETKLSKNTSVYFSDVANVAGATLTQFSAESATVLWQCVAGASTYNVSLYDSTKTELKFHDYTGLCRYHFDNTSSEGDVVTIQACFENPTERCGDPLEKKIIAADVVVITNFESFTWRNGTQLEVCFYDKPANDLTTTTPSLTHEATKPIFSGKKLRALPEITSGIDSAGSSFRTNSDNCAYTNFVLTYETVNQGVLLSVEGCAEPVKEGLLCGSVDVDPGTLSYDKPKIYRVDTEKLKASAEFHMFIQPGILSVERLKEAQVAVVKGVGSEYNINDCSPLSSSTCYFPDLNVPDLLCTNTSDTQAMQYIRVCDATFADTLVANLTAVSSVVLSYEREAIEVWPAEAPSTVHLAICDSQGQDCSACAGLSCPVDKVATSDSHVILIVALDDESKHAISSRRETVQDLRVKTRWLSQDSLEVTWQGAEDVSYSVWTSNDTADLVEVSCSACEHLFIRLSSDDHVVQVQQESSLVRIEVKANFQPVAEANFSFVLQHTTSNGFISQETRCCVTSTSDQKLKLDSFILVDSKNFSLKSTVFDGTNCSTLSVSSDSFDLRGSSRVLVAGEKLGKVFSSQFDLYFFLPQVQQLSNNTGRVSWRNKNAAKSYEMKSMFNADPAVLSSVSCSVGAACRYYVSMDYTGTTLTEKAVVVQTATLTLGKTIIPGLSITQELTPRYDDHLLVCFDPPAGEVYRYELGMEREGELISSDDRAQIQEKEGQTCAVTSKAVLLGGYVNLYAIVVAYNSSGSIISSGEKTYSNLYLSEDSGVYGLVKNNSDLFDLMCSWKLVDDTDSLESYTVSLKNELGGVIESFNVNLTSTTYSFDGLAEGLYVACVAVNGPSFTSKLLCSDSIRATADVSPGDIGLGPFHSFITSDSQVKISWSLSEVDLKDTSAILIEYMTAEMRNAHQIRQPSPLLQSALLHKQDLTVDESKNSGLAGFRIVPATQFSVDLPLTAGSWNICLSAMTGNQAGTPQCQETKIETAPEVGAPENLSYDETSYLLTWEAPSASDGLSLIYYIEGSRGSSLQHTNTSETSVNLADFVGSGEWSIAVHTLQDEKYLSDAGELPVIVNGLEISTAQTGYREMRVSWLEYGADSAPSEAVVYTVNFHESITRSVNCSAECLVYISDPSADPNSKFSVVVTNTKTGLTETAIVYFVDVPTVSGVTITEFSAGRATVVWQCVAEASSYNVSLYDSTKTQLKFNDRTGLCRYNFDDPSIAVVDGDVAKIQARFENPIERCGDSTDKTVTIDTDFTITSLSWTYDGTSDATTLTVCPEKPFATFLVFNLLVASASIGERQYSGVMNDSSSNCIYFNDGGYQPLPSSETIYTLIVDGTNLTLKSSVRFAFGVIVSQLDCNGTKLLRLNAGTLGGELTDKTCPTSTPVDQRGITCYVPDGTPKVCVTNVDESHVDLEVCVTGLKPTSILPSSSELSAETLSYGDSTLAINNSLVSELLIRAALEDFNFKSCTAGKCVVSSMTSGDILYEYCGVLTDETGITVTAVNTFQDIHLELEDSATSINFRFSNRYDAGTYLVYGTNVPDQIDGTTDPILLDCSRIEVGAFCYGFYYSESSPSPTHIAISYSDYSNTVISPVLYTN